MSGLEHVDVVDLVALSADGDAVLIVVKTGRWSVRKDAARLRAKLNTYAQFILDGELIARYPEVDGRPAVIRIDSRQRPPRDIRTAIDVANERLREHGVTVVSHVSPGS